MMVEARKSVGNKEIPEYIFCSWKSWWLSSMTFLGPSTLIIEQQWLLTITCLY